MNLIEKLELTIGLKCDCERCRAFREATKIVKKHMLTEGECEVALVTLGLYANIKEHMREKLKALTLQQKKENKNGLD